MTQLPPRHLPYSSTEAGRHNSYLVVKTSPWPSAKSSFQTTIEWHTCLTQPPGVRVAPERVRMMAEREPLNAEQGRQRATAIALQHGIPTILTVVREVATLRTGVK